MNESQSKTSYSARELDETFFSKRQRHPVLKSKCENERFDTSAFDTTCNLELVATISCCDFVGVGRDLKRLKITILENNARDHRDHGFVCLFKIHKDML